VTTEPSPTAAVHDRRPDAPRGLLQQISAYVARKDPDHYAIRRSVRAAVVMPATFAVAYQIGVDVALYASFGAFATLLFVDYTGPVRARMAAYGALTAAGIADVVLGTLAAPHPVVAPLAMGAIALVVLFAGILGPEVASSATAVLLAFVLPVSFVGPLSVIPARVAGWAMGSAIAAAACLLWWPRPWRNPLRESLSTTAHALSALARAHAHGVRAVELGVVARNELGALRARFESRQWPMGSRHTMALTKLVGRLEWVGDNLILPSAEASTLPIEGVGEINGSVATVLSVVATLVRQRSDPKGEAASVDALARALADLDAVRHSVITAEVHRFVDEEASGAAAAAAAPEGLSLLSAIDPAFHALALAVATQLVGEAALEASGTKTEAAYTTAFTSGWGPRQRPSVMSELLSHLSLSSVWLRNSLRGAVGLALSVGVVELISLSHGFWVVFGTLAVLRSNALGTGASAVRAVLGTAAGFVIGALLLAGLSTHTDALWVILPLSVLVAGIAPAVISFAAGQAGFTVMVLVLFNIVDPVGWRLGITRVEDVAIGCAVSVVVGLLFWPRGARAALSGALGQAVQAATAYMSAAVARVTTPGNRLETDAQARASHRAGVRLDDAFRQYLAERGAKRVTPQDASRLVSAASRARVAAFTLASLPAVPDPGGAVPDEVALAGAVLRDSCAQTQRWSDQFAEMLSGGPLPEPPIQNSATDRVLVQAFDAAREVRRPDLVRMGLRMLWIDELLHSLRSLESDMAGAAHALVVPRGRGAAF